MTEMIGMRFSGKSLHDRHDLFSTLLAATELKDGGGGDEKDGEDTLSDEQLIGEFLPCCLSILF